MKEWSTMKKLIWLRRFSGGGSSDPLITLTGKIISFISRAAKPFKSTQVAIEPVQSGTGDPSPDNVRPISGWTGATVYDVGTNLWDEEWELGGYSSSTGAKTSGSNTIRSKNFIPCLPNTDYYFFNGKSGIGQGWYVFYYDADKVYKGSSGGWSVNGVKTTPATAYYMTFQSNASYGTTYNNDISINYPSTDHDYHAYSGTSVTLTFGSTVYGGTATDNGDGSWTVVVDRAKKVFDGTETIAYSRTSATNGYAMFVIGSKGENIANSGLSNILKPVTSGVNTEDWSQMVQNSSAYNRDQIAFRFDNSFDGGSVQGSVNNYKAELARLYAAETPLEVVYTLVEPITFTVSGDTLETLVGTNNAWADTGNITAEVYGTPMT